MCVLRLWGADCTPQLKRRCHIYVYIHTFSIVYDRTIYIIYINTSIYSYNELEYIELLGEFFGPLGLLVDPLGRSEDLVNVV